MADKYRHQKEYPEEFKKRWKDLDKRISFDDPDEADVEEFKKLLNEYPEMSLEILDLEEAVEIHIINGFYKNPLMRLAIKNNARVIREELGYEDADQLKRIIINLLKTCWLKYKFEEVQASGSVDDDMMRWSRNHDREKQLSGAFRRYRQAIREYMRYMKWMA